jgi:uncharacterized Zn-finger protein
MIRPSLYKSIAMALKGPVHPAWPAGGNAPETLFVETSRVMCDGSGGALGHPRVYLEMGDESFVECPYCDRRFELNPGARRQAGH